MNKLAWTIFRYKIKRIFCRNRKKIKVILKLDDLRSYETPVKKMDKLVKEENISVSWGIIGRSLEKPSEEYLKFLKDKKNDKNYHFFNYGYLHLWQGTYEFNGPNIDEQYNYLKKTQDIVKEKTGIILDCFGAPCNQISDNTTIALKQISEIKYWYFGQKNFCGTVYSMPSNINCVISLCPYVFETKAGSVDFYHFKRCWKNNIIIKKEPIILQAHPYFWTDIQWLHFKCCIAYLKLQGAEFVLPGCETKHG